MGYFDSDDGKWPVRRPRCHLCGGEEFTYAEIVERRCLVLGVTDDGVYVIDSSWPPNIDDEGEHACLECDKCGYKWHLDGRDTSGVTTNVHWAEPHEVEVMD